MTEAAQPLSKAFQRLIATPTLPDLGPEARSDRWPAAEVEARLDRFFGERKIAEGLRPWLRSAALLWHDHLEASHELSQQINGPDGSFLHGIMHRREPDYGNAKYWFHRVGRHEAFRELARRTTQQLVPEHQNALLAQLAPNGLWDPFAFIDACEEVSGAGGTDDRCAVLRRVQELEFVALVEHVLDSGRPSA